MDRKKIREKLMIKPVTLTHLNQFNELLRYVFQVTESDLEEGGYEDDQEIAKAKRPVLKAADVIGWFDKKDDQLVSQLAIYPCQVNIHGKIYQMAGLTGVGTYPEYANLGLMKELISLGLTKMREKEQWISYLYPYNIPYYRRKGWEIISDRMTFKIRDSQLPKAINVPGTVEREPIDHPDVPHIYNAFAKQNHGAMIRDELAWEEYWRWENEEERIAAIYYDANNQPTGFCLYWIAEEIFHIKELIYLNQEARKGLWNFITAHFSMIHYVEGTTYKNEPIAFLFDDSEITETITPYFMARIVDAEKFIQHYPFQTTTEPFHFVITDPIADWNNRMISLTWDEQGELTLGDTPVGQPVTLDIQTLTSLLMSYKRPTYLHKIERLQTDSTTLKHLEGLISNETAYFSDYF
ncbi:GNAT family N-acetyltransferase [Vagococcus humatus]|uniref:GNAT family N-acetyltransferase n=1 Tax=Vagococcus humatus TaxID=1889241 RepID=A0A3R9ZWN0_9ENTE|nr:GNAT family N-acetyltransferase [Vagococcus humatus]RST89494.1 GNAT family N-acetyltransferase [Vagococcus humatus]